jgi:hypothetical protein
MNALDATTPLLAAGAFLLIGAAILAWPRTLLRAYVRLVKPMRGLFGSVVDWEVGLLESRAAPWLVRLFGLFVIFAGGSILFFRQMQASAG